MSFSAAIHLVMGKKDLTRVNKLQAAVAQVNAAIEMLFLQMHSVPIHTVAAAAFRVLSDLAKMETNPPRSLDLQTKIKPGKEGEFWSRMNFAANFFKHADKDADGTYEFSPEANDLLIFWAISLYRDMKGHDALSVEMKTFISWFFPQWPDILSEGPERTLIESMSKIARVEIMPRSLLLEAGQKALIQAREKQEHLDRWPNLRVPIG